MMAHSEMRDGNAPAKEGNARVLLEALERLPGAVEEVLVRSDSGRSTSGPVPPDRTDGAFVILKPVFSKRTIPITHIGRSAKSGSTERPCPWP